MAFAVLFGGCAGASSGGSSITATGRTLRIVLSVPPGGASNQVARDVLDAEQLAFDRSPHTGLTLLRVSGSKLSDNARTAIQDRSAIAYLGETAPGDSADSIGITNGQDLLQVSPTDTAQALTQNTSAVSGAPSRYYESLKTYGRTFARVVPTTVQEAAAELAEARHLGIKMLYVASDGSAYGAALASSLRAGAAGVSVRFGLPTASAFSASGADGLLFAGRSRTMVSALFASVAPTHPAVALMAPSALADPSFAGSLPTPASVRLIVSTPGFSTATLTAAGLAFRAAFTSTYHRAPVAQAIFGYEAMAAVLAVVRSAGNNRAAVVHGFTHLSNRSSVLGTYSIDKNGDTNLNSFVFERLRAGQLVPVRG